MAKNKYYVVWDGHQTGVFSSWDKCKQAVHNYPKAKYKGFPNLALAEKAFKENYFDYVGQKFKKELFVDTSGNVGTPIAPSISVDAACSGNPGVMEYRGVDNQSGKEIFRIPPMEQGTNNIGEFLGIVHALALLKNKDLDVPIYTDSKIAISWIKQKKCKTQLEKNKSNQKLFELIQRAENWLKTNSYTTPILKWETKYWGEIPADFGRK
ncbi:MAG: ribonuclease H family protein [Bacteroidota bacterium]|nr:ribonuclease H family protein [Bacteroidota bacterium]